MNPKRTQIKSYKVNKIHSRIKVFFIDLDGTLVDSKINNNRVISKINKQEISYAIEKGKEIIISTGRLGKKATTYIQNLGTNYSICGNGSQIWDKDFNVVKEWRLSVAQVKKVFEICRKYKLTVKVDDDDVAYGSASKNIVSSRIVSYFGYKLLHNKSLEPQNNLKISIWGKSKYVMPKIEKIFHKEVPGINTSLIARGWIIELTSSEASKGKAAKFIVENYLKLDEQAEIAHIGDSLNDSSAAKEGFFLIAMRNSDHRLIEYATHLGPNYKLGGVAEILKGHYIDIS